MRMPTYFISHGGGPWPWLKKEMPFYDELERSLASIPQQLPSSPRAILMISAHWEQKEFSVMSHPKPPMIYDYGGFPEHTYHIQYPAPGNTELAKQVQSLIESAGLKAQLDDTRGYDHGSFTPLYVMYPRADVPIVQLSIRKDYDPQVHIELGQSLKALREQGVLIVGSGLSYHNLRNFGHSESATKDSKEFDDWLNTTLALAPEKRKASLLNWSSAPSARLAHPREDHLVPLFVALGAAEEETATSVYHEDNFFGGLSVSSFRFG